MDPEIQWIPPAAHKVLGDHSRISHRMLVGPRDRICAVYIIECWFGPQLASIYPTMLVWAPVGQYICSIYLVISGYMINKYAVLLFVFEIINYFIYDSEHLD